MEKAVLILLENICLILIKQSFRQKKFPGDENELVDSIGCNLWRLIEELKMYGK